MRIYLAHSQDFDFNKLLYEPIRKSSLYQEHVFVFPHENPGRFFNSEEYLKNECELVIAEVSYPSIGLGIELGLAHIFKVPIVCIHTKGAKLSGSLKVVTKHFIEYSDNEELISRIKDVLSKFKS